MDKGEVCEVCGGTESKLVDGYYYCVECGTQDTTVRETVVEQQMLQDGQFAIGRRTKYSVKMKEGVEMSPEWYQWHTQNFMLAGLTEQLIELGAAPSLRMKVLWIWSRYIKMFQKKDEMSRFKALSQLEESESSSDGEATDEAAAAARARLARPQAHGGPRLDRVGGKLLVAILALALNLDRSGLQLSHVTRLVWWRLLAVNDALRFVPAELARRYRRDRRLYGTLFVCNDLPQVMGRLSRMLDLGPPRVPDVEALVASQLRELRLPPGLARLVHALMRLLPVPWELRIRDRHTPRVPDYEMTVLAYIIVALKMCFGLDDDYEVRLSDAVERINSEERRPRASASDPEPTDRLFSFRAWAAHLRRRALLLARRCGPLAWQRNMRTSDDALMEHFEELTTAWAGGKKKIKPLLSDEVTMDIIGRIPRAGAGAGAGAAPPLRELRAAAAAREPAAALAARLAPRELDEDFTRYSLAYACRRLALPGPAARALEGVADARKAFRDKIGQHLGDTDADPTVVYVKDCENKNWAKTRRPTAAHVVPDESAALGDSGGAGEWAEDRKLETFEEETEGRNIFDDDFFSLAIKKEKSEAPDLPESFNDETNDMNRLDDFWHESSSMRRESAAEHGGPGWPRGVFDSDEDSGPRYDASTFDRAETIKRIMIAAYKKYIGLESKFPVRFRTQRRPLASGAPRRLVEDNNRAETWARKRERHDGKNAIGDVVSAYQNSLARDAMHQIAEEVRRFTDAADGRPDLDLPDPADPGDGAVDEDPDESRDVQLIENDDKNARSDDDSFDGAAYDPVYKGDAEFDEKTHDASQLFLKLKDVPAAPPTPTAADLSFLDDERPDDDELRQQEKRQRYEKDQMKRKWRQMKQNIDHLVDDPESITKFNYWFKHYESCKSWEKVVVQVEIDESFPRSFRFVMRECVATLGAGAAAGALYRRVCDVERVLLQLLWRPRRPAKRRPSASPAPARRPKAKLSKKSKNYAKVSSKHKNYAKVSHYTSDDESDSALVSDDASVSRDEMSENEGVSKENIIPDDEPDAGQRRRSGRIREKEALDPFWR